MVLDKGQRLARGSLSRTAILDSALAVISRDGVDRLTMRSLAEHLGGHPTSMYRHFRNKDDLLAALVDRLLDDLEIETNPDVGWREILLAVSDQLRRKLSRHPGAVSLLAASPYSPNGLRLMDTVIAALARAGLPLPLAGQALRTTFTYTVGHAATTPASTEPTIGFWNDVLRSAVPTSDYPALTDSGGWQAPPEAEFAAGMHITLNGIAAALHASTNETPTTPIATTPPDVQ